MLPKTTIERLESFRMPGFIDALRSQMETPAYQDLSFEERLTLLVDSEHTRRLDQRTRRMLREARLPRAASIEEVDFSFPRGLDKKTLLNLVSGSWVSSGTNVIITGATGLGKTFLASVIADSIIKLGASVRFHRTHHLLADFAAYIERKRLFQAFHCINKVKCLIFDEWLLDELSIADSRILLDLFDARYRRTSCMFITQYPVSAWHARFADPTLADAILDRLVHHAIRIELAGDKSMRAIPETVITSLRSDNLD